MPKIDAKNVLLDAATLASVVSLSASPLSVPGLPGAATSCNDPPPAGIGLPECTVILPLPWVTVSVAPGTTVTVVPAVSAAGGLVSPGFDGSALTRPSHTWTRL